ncbi:MAG: hypothetical protein ACYSWS_01175 [Planctomycetota bacterium]|jgi:hypothetical protein
MEFITSGETDYVKLFGNAWCPLLGYFPSTGRMTSDDQITRSIEIIREARNHWNINPFYRYEVVDIRMLRKQTAHQKNYTNIHSGK